MEFTNRFKKTDFKKRNFMSNNKTYLFLLTIGPVQSFIAQARKTQDLYAGSQLLSDLIGFAMNQTQESGEIIFPFLDAKSKPNRFVAKITCQDVKVFGNNLQVKVKEELNRIAKDALGKWFEVASYQIDDFLETYWTAIIYDENKKYNEQYKELERTLGGIKNYRVFKQLSLPEQGRKCSVNGFYDALFYRKLDRETQQDITFLREQRHLNNNAIIVDNDTMVGLGIIQKGEGICGLTLLKRRYKENAYTFPSTANIALLHILNNPVVKDSGTLTPLLICDGASENTIDNFNGQLLFSENINSEYFKKQDIKCREDAFSDCFESFKKVVEQENLKFLKYYAVIVFDADDMGKKLSACDSIEKHKELSRKLSEYAKCAREYIDEGRGKTIYAGGDDFMGLLNLTTLFESIQKLRETFEEQFQAEQLTFSAGIAIAHYKAPLGEVLNYARKMEHKAKEQDGKNAFGIAVMKQSGEIHETILPWVNSLKEYRWYPSILKLIQESLKDKISPSFIKTLNEEISIWDNKSSDFAEITSHEIVRLLSRANKFADKKLLETIAEDILSLYNDSNFKDKTDYFTNALNIADFINRKF